MKHIFKKYEFQDESTAQSRIDALPKDEEGNFIHSHTIVKLGHVVVTEGSYDEEGNEVSAPVLASNYSVDVLWSVKDITQVDVEEVLDEQGNVVTPQETSISYPYGWASKEISIEEGNGVHTFAGWSFNS